MKSLSIAPARAVPQFLSHSAFSDKSSFEADCGASGGWRRSNELERCNLCSDVGESRNLAPSNPDKLQELEAVWDQWNATLEEPRWAAKQKPKQERKQKAKQKAKRRKLAL